MEDNVHNSAPPLQSNSTSNIIGTGRLEAFSDGVMAVIITIMVLELRPPEGLDAATWSGLWSLHPKFLVYALSFTFVAIYWNNHHHLLRATRSINSSVMWANLHLLFWLSLVPFVTAWAGTFPGTIPPAVTYGAIGLLAGTAYYILVHTIIHANHGTDIEKAIGGDIKGTISLFIYATGMALALITPILAYLTYAVVSVIWFIPDRRLVGSKTEGE